ncbi:hypothetical protein A2U01_0075543, partial [Trifolium medium]|nr:hypothetical protein [Trifolium medium]
KSKTGTIEVDVGWMLELGAVAPGVCDGAVALDAPPLG